MGGTSTGALGRPRRTQRQNQTVSRVVAIFIYIYVHVLYCDAEYDRRVFNFREAFLVRMSLSLYFARTTFTRTLSGFSLEKWCCVTTHLMSGVIYHLILSKILVCVKERERGTQRIIPCPARPRCVTNPFGKHPNEFG